MQTGHGTGPADRGRVDLLTTQEEPQAGHRATSCVCVGRTGHQASRYHTADDVPKHQRTRVEVRTAAGSEKTEGLLPRRQAGSRAQD